MFSEISIPQKTYADTHKRLRGGNDLFLSILLSIFDKQFELGSVPFKYLPSTQQNSLQDCSVLLSSLYTEILKTTNILKNKKQSRSRWGRKRRESGRNLLVSLTLNRNNANGRMKEVKGNLKFYCSIRKCENISQFSQDFIQLGCPGQRLFWGTFAGFCHMLCWMENSTY